MPRKHKNAGRFTKTVQGSRQFEGVSFSKLAEELRRLWLQGRKPARVRAIG